jgi:hypothetical protein
VSVRSFAPRGPTGPRPRWRRCRGRAGGPRPPGARRGEDRGESAYVWPGVAAPRYPLRLLEGAGRPRVPGSERVRAHVGPSRAAGLVLGGGETCFGRPFVVSPYESLAAGRSEQHRVLAHRVAFPTSGKRKEWTGLAVNAGHAVRGGHAHRQSRRHHHPGPCVCSKEVGLVACEDTRRTAHAPEAISGIHGPGHQPTSSTTSITKAPARHRIKTLQEGKSVGARHGRGHARQSSDPGFLPRA